MLAFFAHSWRSRCLAGNAKQLVGSDLAFFLEGLKDH